MTVQFYNWQGGLQPGAPYTRLSPNLDAVCDEIGKLFGGYSLGGFYVRQVRGGGAWSSHAFGSARDWRIEDAGMRSLAMAWLIQHYEKLGIQAIHDYFGCRIWRANRYPDQPAETWWRAQTPKSTGMGQSWALYLHIETDPGNWGNSVPVPNREGFKETPDPTLPAFVPECGIWGLWPFDESKPTLREVDGLTPIPENISEATRYLQGVLVRKASQTIRIDGDFGPMTAAAVNRLQSWFKLTVDEVVGPKTWALIDSLAGR